MSVKMSRSLSQISRHAISNAQSFLKFEKDRPAVHRDATYDLRELGFQWPRARLANLTGILLIATISAAETDELDAIAKRSLDSLCDWVESELARTGERVG